MTKTADVITQIVEEFNEVEKEFHKKAQNALKKVFKEFFKDNPRIKQIYWTQYTPYFNDGDECIFGVHSMYANVSEKPYEFGSENDIEEADGTIVSYGTPLAGFEEETKNFKEFDKIINTLPDNVFYSTFGDHVQVIASREGFAIEEYEHE